MKNAARNVSKLSDLCEQAAPLREIVCGADAFREIGSIYNPNSVMKAIRNDDIDSYWTQTSAAESLMGYISLDFDGLGRTVSDLIGGVETKVDTIRRVHWCRIEKYEARTI